MKCNIGRKNRIARFVGGIVVLALSILYYPQNIVLSVIGVAVGILMVLKQNH